MSTATAMTRYEAAYAAYRAVAERFQGKLRCGSPITLADLRECDRVATELDAARRLAWLPWTASDSRESEALICDF